MRNEKTDGHRSCVTCWASVWVLVHRCTEKTWKNAQKCSPVIISQSHNDGLLVLSSLCFCLVLKVLCRSCFAFVIRKENKAFPINMTCPAQSARAMGTRDLLFADPRGCPVSGGAECRASDAAPGSLPRAPLSACAGGPPTSHGRSLVRSVGSDEDPAPNTPLRAAQGGETAGKEAVG